MFIPALTFSQVVSALLMGVGVLLVALASTVFVRNPKFPTLLGVGALMMAGGFWLADSDYREDTTGAFVLGGVGLVLIASDVIPLLFQKAKRNE